MASWPTEDVEVIAAQKDWQRLRADPRFIELMRLARAANALALAYGPLAHTLEDQSPGARRNRFAAFAYTAAMLKEALETAGTLGRYYKDHAQYKEGLGALLSDPAVRRLRESHLDELRDKFVFHFERKALANALLTFPTNGDVRIISYPTSGPTVGETYFDAADDAAFGHLFGDAVNDAEYFARVRTFIEEVSGVLFKFMAGAHRLVAIGLVELGCMKRSMARPLASTDDAN